MECTVHMLLEDIRKQETLWENTKRMWRRGRSPKTCVTIWMQFLEIMGKVTEDKLLFVITDYLKLLARYLSREGIQENQGGEYQGDTRQVRSGNWNNPRKNWGNVRAPQSKLTKVEMLSR